MLGCIRNSILLMMRSHVILHNDAITSHIKMNGDDQSQARPNRDRINHLKHYTQYQIYGNSNEFHFKIHHRRQYYNAFAYL